MHGESVTQVMQPWLIARAIGTTDPRMSAQAPECLLDGRNLQSGAGTRHEEWRTPTLRMAGLLSPRCILNHGLLQLRPKCDHSRFVELRVANGDNCGREVYIRQREGKSFANN